MEASVGVAEWMTGVGLAALVLLICATLKSQWRFWLDAFHYRGRLPRGSYGWPLLGESLSLMTSSPKEFAQSRAAKYGKVFKSHLYGDPTIMITSPDVARALYSMPMSQVKLTGPDYCKRLLGERVFGFLGPADQEGVHKLIQNFFFPQSFGPYIPNMEKEILNQLNAWDGQIVNAFQATKKLAGNVVTRLMVGFGLNEDDHLLSEIVELFRKLYYPGMLSVPVNLPGTGYYKGLKSREQIADIFQYLIEKREKSSALVRSQDSLLKRMAEHTHPSTGEKMLQSEIIDNLITVLFAGFDTTPSTFSLTLRHLSENPRVFDLIKEEQEAIAMRKLPGQPLTMDDLKGMHYTSLVLSETLRFPGPVPFSLRETMKDVQISGYTIPKGWKICNLFTVYQQDPSFFSNPAVFDPSRFSEAGGSNSVGFTPFGGGRHMCPARELAKAKHKILMHHFVTKFRWEPVNIQQGFDHYPVLVCSPKGGFQIRVSLLNADTKSQTKAKAC